MIAYTRNKYGGPEVLKLDNTKIPALMSGQIRIKVVASSANPADWRIIRGKPFFARFTFGLLQPKYPIPGVDFAGIVVSVGNQVSRFKVGDRVFGEVLLGGAFAEYINVDESRCSHMPAKTDFIEMASVPLAGITALQALINHGKLKRGETVLINGSTGGVGHIAVQIARAHGAHVTAVCSSKNTAFAFELGADEVIAYDKENIHYHDRKYDLVIDNHGNLTFDDLKRLGGRSVVVGFTSIRHMILLQLKKSFSKYPFKQFTAEANRQDLEILAMLVESGRIVVHLDKVYPFSKVPEAIAYVEKMRTRGKVAIVFDKVSDLNSNAIKMS